MSVQPSISRLKIIIAKTQNSRLYFGCPARNCIDKWYTNNKQSGSINKNQHRACYNQHTLIILIVGWSLNNIIHWELLTRMINHSSWIKYEARHSCQIFPQIKPSPVWLFLAGNFIILRLRIPPCHCCRLSNFCEKWCREYKCNLNDGTGHHPLLALHQPLQLRLENNQTEPGLGRCQPIPSSS